MTTSVNFELAKLLKEKGFDLPCRLCVTDDDDRPLPFNGSLHVNSKHPYYSSPSIVEVVMWLYEKYDIDVSVYGKLPYIVFPDSEYGEGELQWHFEYRVIQNRDGQKCEVIEPKTWFDERTEAYEVAIEYCLRNLI